MNVLGSIYCIESIIMVISNIFAIVIKLHLKNAERSFHGIVLLVLFVAHLISGIFNLVIAGIIIAGTDVENLDRRLTTSRDSVCGLEIMLTILLSLERFVAVRKPFLYENLTKFHAKCAFGVTMLVTIALSLLLFKTKKVYNLGYLITILGGLFIAVSNTLLYRSAKRQCEEISKTIVDQSEKAQTQKRNDMRKRKLKSLKICIFITASYLLTWFPLVIVKVSKSLFDIETDLVFIFFMVGFSNGIWDVLIYFYLNQKARYSLLELFGIERINVIESIL